MKALTFNGVRAIGHETVPDPALTGPRDAVVQVELAAVCGSDLHVYHGRERGLDQGTVLGHEFVGRVVETGSGVRGLRRGDAVLSPFSTSCGDCFFCRGGLTSRCESGELFGWVEEGRGLQGAQAEFVRVPLAESTLVPVPEGVSPEEALLLGDVLSTGYYCARQARIDGDTVCVVVGCGPVGLMAIVGARELGAETVFAVDRVPERLALARKFGAHPLNVDDDVVLEAVRGATEGRGADAVLEVVGNESAHRLAFDLIRSGGTISVVGVHNEAQFAFAPAEAYDKNLTYRVGRCPARAVMQELVPVLLRKQHDVAAIVSHRLPLAEGARAYEIFDRKSDGCTKVLLTPR